MRLIIFIQLVMHTIFQNTSAFQNTHLFSVIINKVGITQYAGDLHLNYEIIEASLKGRGLLEKAENDHFYCDITEKSPTFSSKKLEIP